MVQVLSASQKFPRHGALRQRRLGQQQQESRAAMPSPEPCGGFTGFNRGFCCHGRTQQCGKRYLLRPSAVSEHWGETAEICRPGGLGPKHLGDQQRHPGAVRVALPCSRQGGVYLRGRTIKRCKMRSLCRHGPESVPGEVLCTLIQVMSAGDRPQTPTNMAPSKRGILDSSSGSREQNVSCCHSQSRAGDWKDEPELRTDAVSHRSGLTSDAIAAQERPSPLVLDSFGDTRPGDAARAASAAMDADYDAGEAFCTPVQSPDATPTANAAGSTQHISETPQHAPTGLSLRDTDGAISLAAIEVLIRSALSKGTVRGERVFRRNAGSVCRLAREECGPVGLVWTEAAWQGALEAAMSGLDGLVGVPKTALLRSFRQVVVSTAAAHMEGLKQRGREGRLGGVRGRVQADRRTEMPSQIHSKRGGQRTSSDCDKQLKARSDPHTLHCHECGATAEFGLRGSKEGGKVKYLCEGHATCSGCFRVDKERRAWAEDWELRCLRREVRRLEEQLRQLGGTSSAVQAAPARNEFPTTGSWASMHMSQSLIATLLMIGGVECNPGPAAAENWRQAYPTINATLLNHLANRDVDLAAWREMPSEKRFGLLAMWADRYKREWSDSWDMFLIGVPGTGTSAIGDPRGGAQLRGDQAGWSYNTVVDPLGRNSEGISRRQAEGKIFTPRMKTVHKILSRLQASLVLLLAATPRSGKTSICQLVCDVARMSQVYEPEDVIYVNCAEVGSGGKSFEDVFLEQARVPFSEASKSPSSSPEKQLQRPTGNASSSSCQVLVSKKKLIVLDEIQTTYDEDAPGHDLLWPLLKGLSLVARNPLAARTEGSVNFLLSASRGSNPAAEGLKSTSFEFLEEERIPLRPRPEYSLPNDKEPALQFTWDEYEELFDSFRKSCLLGWDQLHLQTLSDVIEATTERHPGSVLHILDTLRGHSPSNYAGREAEWAAKAVEFVTSPELLDTLGGTRSFPKARRFMEDKTALDLIRKLLANGGKEMLEPFRRSDPVCAKKAEALARSGHMLLEGNLISFTSSLHMEFYRYNLARLKWSTGNHVPESIENFLCEALTKMRPVEFQNSLNLSTRGGVLGEVLEAHFQFELYSAITSLLPDGAYISPTVGKVYGLEAYVDFVVVLPDKKWALELLVDGRDLKEHERRFHKAGRYFPMLGTEIEAWIVVDLRNPETAKLRRVRGSGVCHVFFDAGYKKARIDFGNGGLQEVLLSGRA